MNVNWLVVGEEDMDRIIINMPGMKNLLRCRDLPSFYRENINDHVAMDTIVLKSKQALEADAIIINTFEDLEGPVLSEFRQHFPKLYTIGPLHYHLKASFKSSFFEVDGSCMTWLDAQPQRSVIYVSFGSITSLKREELLEIWHGLVKSKQRFLWVMRPDMVLGKEGSSENKVQLELEEGTKERGFIVGWAPQEEVLAHKAIGGFLTHSGWNSTLEAVVAGVPMICWPYFADQQINSRFVSEVWKLGLDMKDVSDRNVVEKMVNDIMVHRKEEFLKSAQEMAELAHKSVNPGGSSYICLDELLQFIKSSIPKNH